MAGKTRVTPSMLGLQLYARSQGNRGGLEKFYEVSAQPVQGLTQSA
jgi:hypothetical protein